MTACKNCATGKNQAITGQTTCVSCGKGQISDTRSKPCASCKAGLFQPKTVATKFAAVPISTWLYRRQYSGRCSDVSGQNVIDTALKCAQARNKLGIYDDYSGNLVRSGHWSYLPQGCSMWGSRIHFNTYGHKRSCDYSSAKYCICKGGKIYIINVQYYFDKLTFLFFFL